MSIKSKIGRAFAAAAVAAMGIGSSLLADEVIGVELISNGSFEDGKLTGGGGAWKQGCPDADNYATGWTGTYGLSNKNGIWCNKDLPDGNRIMFLQMDNKVSTVVALPTHGLYRLSFWHTQRSGGKPNHLTIISVDGKEVMRVTADSQEWKEESCEFEMWAGERALVFTGVSNGTDQTGLFDKISLVLVKRLGDSLTIAGSPADYGEVSPAYGVKNGLAANDSFDCSAPAQVEVGDVHALCVGYQLYKENNDEFVAWGEPQTGNSFTYTHPDDSAAKLEWLWEVRKPAGIGEVAVESKRAGAFTVSANVTGVGYDDGDTLSMKVAWGRDAANLLYTNDVGTATKAGEQVSATLTAGVMPGVTHYARVFALDKNGAVAGEGETIEVYVLSKADMTLTWTGANSSDWAEAGNWNPAQVPAAGDVLVIPAELEVYPQLAPVNWPENGSYASLTVAAGAKIVCLGDKAADGLGRGPWITADEMLIDGTLDAAGQGFSGNNTTTGGQGYGSCSAAHGGISAWRWLYHPWNCKYGGVAYGNCEEPTELGSSGAQNVPGGGAIKLVSSGTITVNGRIDASAKAAPSSGGSVWIVCKTLAGSADGVIAANAFQDNSNGDGGGGGRISLDYENKTFAGSVQVNEKTGVRGDLRDGMPGTIYEPKRYPLGTPEEPAEITLSSSEHFTYVFPNDGKTRYWKLSLTGSNARVGFLRGKIDLSSLSIGGSGSALWFGRWGGSMEESCTVEGEALKNLSLVNSTRLMLPGADKQRVWNFDSLSVASGSYLYFGGADLVNKRGTVINVSGDMTVAGTISLDQTGSCVKLGGDQGESSMGGAHGGSMGWYAKWEKGYYSDYYGSFSAPVTLGKSRSDLHDSGGALELNVVGTLTLGGTISVKGASGGGAGGSIWAKLGKVSGAGKFCADAGAQESYQLGSGGRISIEVAEGENAINATVEGRTMASGYSRIGYPGTVFRSQGPRIAALSSDYAVSGLSNENMPVTTDAEASAAITKTLRAYRVVSVNRPSSKFAWTERFVLNTPDGEIAYPNTVTYTISDLTPNVKYRVTHNGVARQIKADADGKLVFSAEFQNGLEPDSFVVDKTGLVIMLR